MVVVVVVQAMLGTVGCLDGFGNGDWSQRGQRMEGSGANDQFGAAVALSPSGLYLVVGAPGGGTSTSSSGYSRVFEYAREINLWEQQGSQLDGESNNDQFGYAVAMSQDGTAGTNVAVASPFNDRNGLSNSGRVERYKFDSNP
mmetsp:Transcript_1188/g.2187  ORF Transcript_1188/g.2187 Transcript_1188/m.2187 type:complete len:143 (-) Transcript_1188:54-482(-)